MALDTQVSTTRSYFLNKHGVYTRGPLRRPVCFEDSYKCAYTNWRVRVKVGFVAVYGPFICLRWNRVRQEGCIYRRGKLFAIGIRKRVYRVQ